MTNEELRTLWKQEEECAFIKGWDFGPVELKTSPAQRQFKEKGIK